MTRACPTARPRDVGRHLPRCRATCRGSRRRARPPRPRARRRGAHARQPSAAARARLRRAPWPRRRTTPTRPRSRARSRRARARATYVARSAAGSEGGATYAVTFATAKGDVAPLLAQSSLTGQGAAVTTLELTKGSEAIGSALAVSFDAPLFCSQSQVDPSSGCGAPVTRFAVELDSTASFRASPTIVSVPADYSVQTVRVGAAFAAEPRAVRHAERRRRLPPELQRRRPRRQRGRERGRAAPRAEALPDVATVSRAAARGARARPLRRRGRRLPARVVRGRRRLRLGGRDGFVPPSCCAATLRRATATPSRPSSPGRRRAEPRPARAASRRDLDQLCRQRRRGLPVYRWPHAQWAATAHATAGAVRPPRAPRTRRARRQLGLDPAARPRGAAAT